ncbi:reverse transcriptase/maturase family protein [Blautia obeum]|uniref:reverse transcriptase/maturase family protein n=1 Tax=Blautia obeum TaxID=40520 RepID=UPI003D2BB1F9
MRTAKTVLTVIQERGKQKKPIERVYKLLFNRELYLNAYAKLYPNNGAMTKGVTDETVDGMSIQKIDRMIEILREEKYQWKPARREYIKKKNGKKRPLGIPVWGDKVLQEVMRQILEAYYEPQFSEHSHGFRPNRGCHTALQEIQVWKVNKGICCVFCYNNLPAKNVLSEYVCDYKKRAGLFQRSADLE